MKALNSEYSALAESLIPSKRGHFKHLTPYPPLLSKLKIPSFDKLRMVSEVEPPKAGERENIEDP